MSLSGSMSRYLRQRFAVDVMQEIPHCPFADGEVIRLWVLLHYVSLSSGGLLAREPEHR
jgi:hypothetical protein